MLSALMLALGVGLLLVGGMALVRGAAALAVSAGVSPILVGLTVVAFGTSAPELIVSLTSGLQGVPEIAYGNAVGSNVANLGLILGISALLTPIEIEGKVVRRELPLLLLATTMILVMVLDVPLRGSKMPTLDRSDGLVLILMFGLFLYTAIADVVRTRQDPLVKSAMGLPLPSPVGRARDWVMVITGIVLLALGGQMTITNAVALANTLGISMTLVGLAMIAVGTSLPELITCVIAATRKQPDLCVGNVIGSNLFNGLLVLPTATVLHPVTLKAGAIVDLLVSFAFAGALIPIFIFGRSVMGRRAGAALLGTYVLYIALRFVSTGR